MAQGSAAAPASMPGVARASTPRVAPAITPGVAPVRARWSDARKGVTALLMLLGAASLGCHGPVGVRGYVLDGEGHDHRVYVRDVDYEQASSLPDAHPIAGALVRVEVLGKAGGWVPFGPYAKKCETRTDGLGGFLLEWSEFPHPQDARLLVQKDGFEPLEYRFALPGYQEVRIYLARAPHGAKPR